jgi:hypothetical protein
VSDSAHAVGVEPRVGGSKQFIKNYLQLLTQIASNYKGALSQPKLIHVCGGSLNGLDPCDDIKAANEQFNKMQYKMEMAQPAGGVRAGRMIGYYTTIDPGHQKETPHWGEINGCKEGTTKHCNGKSAFNGCDGHYNGKGHGVLAGDIIPQFRKIMFCTVLLPMAARSPSPPRRATPPDNSSVPSVYSSSRSPLA